MSAKDATRIRTMLLNELGLTPHSISVRSKSERVVELTVKDGNAPLAKIEAIALRFVDTTVVPIVVTKAAKRSIGAPYARAVRAALETLARYPGTDLLPVAPGVALGLVGKYCYVHIKEKPVELVSLKNVDVASFHVARAVVKAAKMTSAGEHTGR